MRSMIVAATKDGVIGDKGSIPWNYPADMKWFKEMTDGQTVVMGRKTYDSLPDRFKPLPNRTNIVVSRSATPFGEIEDVVNPITGAKSKLQFLNFVKWFEDAFYIGGAEVYLHAFPMVDRIFLTIVPDDIKGDTTLYHCWPFEDHGWKVHETHHRDDQGDLQFLEYRRV